MNKKIFGIQFNKTEHFEKAKKEVETSLSRNIGFLFGCIENMNRNITQEEVDKLNINELVDLIILENGSKTEQADYMIENNAFSVFLYLAHKIKEKGLKELRFKRGFKKTGFTNEFISLKYDNSKKIIYFISDTEVYTNLSHCFYTFHRRWKNLNILDCDIIKDNYSIWKKGNTLLIENLINKNFNINLKGKDKVKRMTQAEVKSIIKELEFY